MDREDKVVYLEPSKVKVKEGLERYRRDMGDLSDLGKSLKEKGQIQPIVINRDYELIAGGRRLAACLITGLKVKAIFEDKTDPVEMRVWELEENLGRKDYTPAEYALGVQELHSKMQELSGVSVSGKEGGHRLDDTAKILGKTRGTVIQELEMAEMIKAFPQLREAKKKSEIKSAAKGLAKLTTAMEGLKALEAKKKDGHQVYQLYNEDAVKHMASMSTDSIDILCTDPPYGVGMDKLEQTLGGGTGGKLTTSGLKFNDDEKKSISLYQVLATESFRFTKPDAHGYVFVAPEHFWLLRRIFMEAGWRVHVKPIIWVKREVGQCNVPTAWPSSCYEMLMYIRKDNSKLVKEGQPDWAECPPVLPSRRIHSYEKPVPLLLNLLKRVALPGKHLYDPFAGSGASIEAGIKLDMICEGNDNSTEAYAVASKRLSELTKKEEE